MMARFPSIDSEGAFEAPEVQNSIKELVTGSTAGITVDTSVGTRVFVGDTMIHGDTGWRDITSMWESGLDPSNTGSILIARHNMETAICFDSVTLLEGSGLLTFGDLPPGFRTMHTRESRQGMAYNIDPDMSHLFRVQINSFSWAGVVNLRSWVYTRDRITSGTVRGTITFPSTGWPTSLPGLPA